MEGEKARTQAFWPLLPPPLAHARILEWKDHKAWLQGPAGLDTKSLGDGELHPALGGVGDWGSSLLGSGSLAGAFIWVPRIKRAQILGSRCLAARRVLFRWAGAGAESPRSRGSEGARLRDDAGAWTYGFLNA